MIFCCRYQFFLQLKQDIVTGKLPCPFEVAVQLAGFALQCKQNDCGLLLT